MRFSCLLSIRRLKVAGLALGGTKSTLVPMSPRRGSLRGLMNGSFRKIARKWRPRASLNDATRRSSLGMLLQGLLARKLISFRMPWLGHPLKVRKSRACESTGRSGVVRSCGRCSTDTGGITSRGSEMRQWRSSNARSRVCNGESQGRRPPAGRTSLQSKRSRRAAARRRKWTSPRTKGLGADPQYNVMVVPQLCNAMDLVCGLRALHRQEEGVNRGHWGNEQGGREHTPKQAQSTAMQFANMRRRSGKERSGHGVYSLSLGRAQVESPRKKGGRPPPTHRVVCCLAGGCGRSLGPGRRHRGSAPADPPAPPPRRPPPRCRWRWCWGTCARRSARSSSRTRRSAPLAAAGRRTASGPSAAGPRPRLARERPPARPSATRRASPNGSAGR